MDHAEVRSIVDATPGKPPVRGFLHLPPTSSGDGVVLTHSASGNCESPLLVAVAWALCDAGLAILRCDLPFRQLRASGPPPRGSSERDQQGLRRAVQALRQFAPARMFLGGHSYGGRQASMLAASEAGLAEALLLLSYPLHPPKRTAELRTAHFPSLRTPALVVHGTRDGFGSIPEISETAKLIPVRTQVFPVAGAGHSLVTIKNRDELPMTIAEEFRKFVSD